MLEFNEAEPNHWQHMEQLKEYPIQCPYCGETITVLVDCSISQQNYIEDCQVCCRPINFDVSINFDGEPQVMVSDENE